MTIMMMMMIMIKIIIFFYIVSLSYFGLEPNCRTPFPLKTSLSNYFTNIFEQTSSSKLCKQYFSPNSTNTLSVSTLISHHNPKNY
jgi:hypothetical protein